MGSSLIHVKSALTREFNWIRRRSASLGTMMAWRQHYRQRLDTTGMPGCWCYCWPPGRSNWSERSLNRPNRWAGYLCRTQRFRPHLSWRCGWHRGHFEPNCWRNRLLGSPNSRWLRVPATGFGHCLQLLALAVGLRTPWRTKCTKLKLLSPFLLVFSLNCTWTRGNVKWYIICGSNALFIGAWGFESSKVPEASSFFSFWGRTSFLLIWNSLGITDLYWKWMREILDFQKFH